MDLTDIQVELRKIEEHISLLQAEIEKMKPQTEDEAKAALERITKLAAKHPLDNRRLTEAAATAKDYVSCLSYILRVDENRIYDRLLYLCRLSQGMGLPYSAEDVLRLGMEFDEQHFDEACSSLKDEKYTFLTDALILANITGETADASFSLIADVAQIMGCDKEDLRVIAYVAKAVLTDDFDVLRQMPVPNENRWMGQFGQHIPVSWIESQREFCGKYCTEVTITESYKSLKLQPCKVNSRLMAGSIVRKGEPLVVYEEKELPAGNSGFTNLFWRIDLVVEERSDLPQKTITAPRDGIVFFIEGEENITANNRVGKYVYAYVVSYFDDYADFCQWHKKEKDNQRRDS